MQWMLWESVPYPHDYRHESITITWHIDIISKWVATPGTSGFNTGISNRLTCSCIPAWDSVGWFCPYTGLTITLNTLHKRQNSCCLNQPLWLPICYSLYRDNCHQGRCKHYWHCLRSKLGCIRQIAADYPPDMQHMSSFCCSHLRQ